MLLLARTASAQKKPFRAWAGSAVKVLKVSLVAVLFLQWGGAQAVWRLWSRECLLDAEREVLWRGVLAYNLGLLRETTKAE